MRIAVPDELRSRLSEFIASRGLNWVIVNDGPGVLRIAPPAEGDRRDSTEDTIQAGGQIRCGTAWALAARHDIGLGTLG
ncbi:MAG: hypothetical protein QG656_558, partial [Candidatus Hydrogenedentes bacterium]|nr:hypothetical protein [Candidatus Hydrogenedentota bacterium]